LGAWAFFDSKYDLMPFIFPIILPSGASLSDHQNYARPLHAVQQKVMIAFISGENGAMRRLIIEEPISAASIWARRFALFAATLSLLDIALTRSAKIELSATLTLIGAVLICACTALLLAGTAAVIIWQTGRRGIGRMLSAFVLSMIVLAYPLYLAGKAVSLPQINDVATDLVNPPSFSSTAHARLMRDGLVYGDTSLDWRDAQRRAYPDMQPIVIDAESDEAFQLVQKTIAARGWIIVEQVPPSKQNPIARIDAIDRSLIMGFPNDITIRLTPAQGQTRIDLRAASRFGKHDFGDNARRIMRFAQELQNQLDAR
jgi:uncharacterized protein (DUF1499 family)